MHIDDVRAVVVGEVPSVLEQVQPREHLARATHEGLQQRELLRRQLNLALPTTHLARRGVEPQIADLDHTRPLELAASSERTKARQQLREGERLDEVVVCAGIEPGDPVLDGVARGQHQDGYPYPARAQAAAGLEAAHPRQHHVEHDHVVVMRSRHPEGVLPAAGDVCG
jgi:hypothetical protein